jgi:membrane-bound lytic murein transglycosylase D
LALAFALVVFMGIFPAHAEETGEGDDLDLSHTPIETRAPVPTVDTAATRVLTLDLTRDANDIWDRIRRGFGMPDLVNERVPEQQIFYLNRPAFLKQVLTRGSRYLYYIVEELERRGMPTELALLPMVESNYNPMAYSRARASGLWQFIPSTGRNYKLTQDSWVDERRDVIASTAAALDYLQNLYNMYGDWQLVLASYNWGEGSVRQAMERNRAAGLPVEYDALVMPAETRNYIPKLQAIKNIVAAPELFHLELPYVANEQHFSTFDAPTGIDLATAAGFAEMSIEDFLALNPGYNRPVITTPGQTLVVPIDRADQFKARLDEFKLSGKNWRSHTLARGETLETVAGRHGLTLPQLRLLNGLAANSRVNPGHILLVPNGIKPDGALAVSRLLPANARLGDSRPAIRLGNNSRNSRARVQPQARGKPVVARAATTARARATAKPAPRVAARAAAKPAPRAAAPRSRRAKPPAAPRPGTPPRPAPPTPPRNATR